METKRPYTTTSTIPVNVDGDNYTTDGAIITDAAELENALLQCVDGMIHALQALRGVLRRRKEKRQA